MRPFTRRFRWLALALAVLAIVVAVWFDAIEDWVAQELRVLANARLNPTFDFEDLRYRFPRTVTVHGIRLTSPDPAPESKGDFIEILAIDSLTLVLDEIPRLNQPFRIRRLDVAGPTLRLVRIHDEEPTERLVGFSDLLKEEPASKASPKRKVSELAEVRNASVVGGKVEFDPRDGEQAVMLIEGIVAQLVLTPDAHGAYGIDFSLDHHPVLEITLRCRLLADDRRIDGASASLTLEVAREQDHYLTPAIQKILAERDIKGHLKVEAMGEFDLDAAASAQLEVKLELSEASYAAGGYGLELDRVSAKLSVASETVTLEEVAVDALSGHAKISGTMGLDDSLPAALRFEGTDLQISELLRGKNDAKGVPLFSGLLDFSGSLRGPLSNIEKQVGGEGRLTLRTARLGQMPVLSTIDDALDQTAEALMTREQHGRANLSLAFTLDGDHVGIENLRMNDRWYGLRGHGDAYFDTRLDLRVDGGPVQRVANELGVLGDVIGDLTETLLRAHVTGTTTDPTVGIEVLRTPLY